ncbi:MAG: class I SAM-dependent methyltransferase [Myxococcota bacterium]
MKRHYWVELVELTALGTIARIADIVVLLPRPRLLIAYVGTIVIGIFRSPYRWPRSFEAIRERTAAGVGERELVYGETPVFTAWWIARAAGLRRGQRFVDLTAGRGRPLFGARIRTASVYGYEITSERGAPVQSLLAGVGIEMRIGDGAAADLSDVDLAMVTWTGFTDELRARFRAVALSLDDGAHFVAVDAPLEGNGFALRRQLSVLCTWGIVPVWIYERRRALDNCDR